MGLRQSAGVVRKPSTIVRAISMLVVFAISMAQLVGANRGFICDCGEAPVIVQASHCHGPHGDDCAAEDSSQPCHEGEDRRDHEQAKEDFKGPGGASQPVQIPVPVLAAIVFEDLVAPRVASEWRSERSVEVRGSPPTSVVVAKAVVRLI
jgi:hypothetical protein